MSERPNPWRLDPATWQTIQNEWASIREPGAPERFETAARFGLAFSGGGIRSATFNLGILQALAERRLLRRIDYLSTVSGGGYVGGWLSALIRRQGGGRAEALEQPGPDGIAPPIDGAEAGEHPAILHLRRYSNYLTPRYGIFSIDTLAAVANLSRNLMLNMAVLIGLLAAMLLLPRVLTQAAENAYPVGLGGGDWLLGAAAFLLLWASTAVAAGLQTLSRRAAAAAKGEVEEGGMSQTRVFVNAVLPAFFGVLAFVWWLAANARPDDQAPGGSLLAWAGVGAVAYGVVWTAGWLVAHLVAAKRAPTGGLSANPAALTAPLVGGAVTGALLYGCARILALLPTEHVYWLGLGLGVAVVWEVLCVGIVVHVGMGKRLFSEPMREWLGRAGGQCFALGLPWAALALIALYGPPLLSWFNDWLIAGGGAAWLATTVAGVLLARGEKTGGAKGAAARPWAEVVSRVAPYVFIFGLALFLAAGVERGLMSYGGVGDLIERAETKAGTAPAAQLQGQVWRGRFELTLRETCGGEAGCSLRAWAEAQGADFAAVADEHRQMDDLLADTAPYAALAAAALLATAALLLAWRVDVNLFSMHQFYRNRLTRCYLGASRPRRRGDAFTDFDFADDLALSELKGQRPLHLICTTLNITRSDRLEWQQRQAAPFLFSPSECGFRLPDGRDPGAFRDTEAYMAKESRWRRVDGGARLGMAVSVSGAAASPNMGYHTSPATAFLMTFFNVRLGRWCGNPRHEQAWEYSSPAFGLRYLVSELLASTDEKSPFVNLSDGGHFENLGLYELVRRRCRLVVVCDAGRDPKCEFEDLGNAIRKCRVDLGAEISLDVRPLLAADPAQRARAVIGRIDYSDREAAGVLVYVKPLLKGDEPIDVRHYAATHADFPHQSTGDQWFDEAQFESYRQLGLATGREVFGAYFWQLDDALAAGGDAWVNEVANRLAKSLPTRL